MKLTRAVLRQIKRAIVLLTGMPILFIGLILIPLPGPGVLISFLGLSILSLGFDWPKKYVDLMKEKLAKLIALTKDKRSDIEKKYK